MSDRPIGAHGASRKNPGLYEVDNFSADRMDENSDQRFGRMFPISEGKVDGESRRLLPHPATKYDLRRMGAAGGPLDTKKHGPPADDRDSLASAGMTFLGQFIDHDITLDVTSKFTDVRINAALENGRTPNLDLDCVYGGGREAMPFLYKTSGTKENGDAWENAKLIEGPEIGGATAGQRDLQRNTDGGKAGEGRAIIGDPRNDENIFVAQVQAAFIRFHNKCVDYLHNPPKAKNDKGKLVPVREPIEDDEELFEKARNTTTHYYHRVILEDLLYRVIGLNMIQAIATQGRMYYFPGGFTSKKDGWPEKPFMPVEFSIAAYRYGHSTVRESYAVNGPTDTPLFDKKLRGFQKIPDNFFVDWEWFFIEQNHPPQQFAHRIDPFLPTQLLELPGFAGAENSLASRNLMRGRIFRLPSGEAIARQMVEDGMRIGGGDDAKMTDKHIVGNHVNKKATEVEDLIKTLRGEYALTETPLWLYILMEAALFGKGFAQEEDKIRGGDRLGPVGGRIVGEVLMGLMDHYRDATGAGLDYDPDVPVDKDEGVMLASGDLGPRMSMRAMVNFGYGLKPATS